MSKCLKSGAVIAFMIAAAALSAQGQDHETPAPLDYFPNILASIQAAISARVARTA